MLVIQYPGMIWHVVNSGLLYKEWIATPTKQNWGQGRNNSTWYIQHWCYVNNKIRQSKMCKYQKIKKNYCVIDLCTDCISEFVKRYGDERCQRGQREPGLWWNTNLNFPTIQIWTFLCYFKFSYKWLRKGFYFHFTNSSHSFFSLRISFFSSIFPSTLA